VERRHGLQAADFLTRCSGGNVSGPRNQDAAAALWHLHTMPESKLRPGQREVDKKNSVQTYSSGKARVRASQETSMVLSMHVTHAAAITYAKYRCALVY
jgi:hypothetical protein